MSTDTSDILKRLEAVSHELLAQARSGQWASLMHSDRERRALLDMLQIHSNTDIPDARCRQQIELVIELDRQLLALASTARQSVATESRDGHARQSAWNSYRQARRLVTQERD